MQILYTIISTLMLALPSIAQNIGIPPFFFANYHISEQRDDMLNIFVTIDASRNTGSDLDETFFMELDDLFSDIFPHLPSVPDFRIVYEQCRITTQELAMDYSYNSFSIFLDDCYNPFTKAMQVMNSRYAIQTDIKANPSSGAAPLSVTFDATDSVDPSRDTIPSSNYFWYYKDTQGQDQIIGQGPVVNHTFLSEGNYQVHLTVRSANQSSEGILDGSETIPVEVTPQSALMRVFANGQQLNTLSTTKIGTAEAQRGVVLDGAATVPTGGRTIQSHTRTVSSNSTTLFSQTQEGRPDIVSVVFPTEGQFTVELTVLDNQNNTLTEEYIIVVSDPLAVIKPTPEQGNTSTTFRFDASASYSLVSSIRLYSREIFDADNNRIDTFQGKSISKQFAQPGPYTVRLSVEDDQGRRNSETLQLYVDSTDPLAQFRMTPTEDRQYPSQFRFDAGLSSDVDVINADDELLYQRRFTPETDVVIEEVVANGRQIIASFNEPGLYQAKLLVQDSFGKTDEIVKEIEIESALRPTIFMSPKATNRDIPVTMIAGANLPIISYERDFGDGATNSTTATPRVQHTYQTIGAYPVTLTVYGADNQSNTITDQVFIGEKDAPVVAFRVTDNRNSSMKQVAQCEGEPAYLVYRRDDFMINTSDSINTQGLSRDISLFIQPQNDDIYRQRTLTYSFQEVGCQYIDITIRDDQNSKTSTYRAWFDVRNALPELTNVVLSYPQYGNQIGIGFMQAGPSVNDVFSPEIFDPLLVKVSAQGATDPDGVISYFKRYYYKKDNPRRILETKITPATVPEVFFSLPRTGGEYEFGVTIVDNDGGETPSADVIGVGRTVFFPPDTTNANIPLVTLIQSHTAIKAGEEVTFDVSARVLSDNADFATTRTIKLDVDGDGTYDITTRDDRITHIYREDGIYTPKVAVIYRDNKGVDFAEEIIVEKNLKPLLYIHQNGPFVLVRDISIGSVIESVLCTDARGCAQDSTLLYDLTANDEIAKTAIHRYDTSGQYFLDIMVKDDLGAEASRKYPITIDADTPIPYFYPLTIPEGQSSATSYTITIGNQLNNTVSFLLQYAGTGQCRADIDITTDTNGDGDPANDTDIACNELSTQVFDGDVAALRGQIVYDNPDGEVMTRDLVIQFVDVKNTLSSENQMIYERLSSIINSIDPQNQSDTYLRNLLIRLQSSLDDRGVRSALVLDIQQSFDDPQLSVTDTQINNIRSLLQAFQDDALVAAQGGTAYEQAKAEILLLAGTSRRPEVEPYFVAIENTNGSTDEIRNQLQLLTEYMQSQVGIEGGIDQTDLNLIIMPNICRILNYYTIPSETCAAIAAQQSDEFVPSVPEDTDSAGSPLRSILRRVLIVLGVLILIFGGLVGFFALKAKRAQAAGNTDQG